MITTLVMKTGPYRYDMVGQSLPRNLTETDEKIDPTLAQTLYAHAVERMTDCGFEFITAFDAEVSTTEASNDVVDRLYSVAFISKKGSQMKICGIMINDDHEVVLDHGLDIEESL